jgi:radical SAM superfamily enzyme YgiQ (UPF0313 family)
MGHHRRLDLLLLHAEAGLTPLGTQKVLPPLGLIELASFLTAHGFRCRVIDARHRDFTLTWLAGYLAEHRPRWVGIDVFTDTLFTATRLVRIVRNLAPESRVVLGGAHATMCSEDVLLELMPDAVVRGDGELPCADLLSKRRLADVPGIAFKRGSKVVLTPPPPLLDLDKKPTPDYCLIENLNPAFYVPMVSTGRGCPYRCAFCAAGTLSPTVRWRSVPLVIQDIAAVRAALGGQHLVIADDTFTVDAARTEAFCNAIVEIGGGRDFVWYAEGRVDRLTRHPALLAQLRAAGLRFLQLGIESGDERVLAAYRKQIRLDDAVELCRACAREGIFIHAGFIVGGPFESAATLANTRALFMHLAEASAGHLQVRFEFLNPLPATDVFDHPEQYGLSLLDRRLYSSVSFDNCVTETEALSWAEIHVARKHLYADAAKKLREVFEQQDERFYQSCRDLIATSGAGHASFRFLLYPQQEPKEQFSEMLRVVTAEAAAVPQFFASYEHFGMDAIPTRIHIPTLGPSGRYHILPAAEELTPAEHDFYHYCSGKLTAEEIAIILDWNEEQTTSTLRSLEAKRAILYRTY